MRAGSPAHRNQRDSLCFQSHQRTVPSTASRPPAVISPNTNLRLLPTAIIAHLERIFRQARTANIRPITLSCQASYRALTAHSNNALGSRDSGGFNAAAHEKPALPTRSSEAAGRRGRSRITRFQGVEHLHEIKSSGFQLRFLKLALRHCRSLYNRQRGRTRGLISPFRRKGNVKHQVGRQVSARLGLLLSSKKHPAHLIYMGRASGKFPAPSLYQLVLIYGRS